MKGSGLLLASIGLLALSVAAQESARSAEPDNFLVRTTQDMVALCKADAGSANQVAAIHFCHGFASGAYQYYQSVAAASPKTSFICLPNPTPTRSAAIAEFVAWAQGKPSELSAKPVDSMFRFLAERFPCASTPAN